MDVFKIELTCPFCLNSTTRWKAYGVVQGWNPRLKQYELEIVKSQQTDSTAWQHRVLQEHLAKCTARDYLSDVVVQKYGLVK